MVLVPKYYWTHKVILEMLHPLQFFGRIWKGLTLILLYIFGRILLRSHQILGFLLLLGGFDYWFNFIWVICLFRLSLLHDFVLPRYVSRDLSISFRLSNLLVYNYSQYSCNLFISVKVVIRSFFISDFLSLSIFS